MILISNHLSFNFSNKVVFMGIIDYILIKVFIIGGGKAIKRDEIFFNILISKGRLVSEGIIRYIGYLIRKKNW